MNLVSVQFIFQGITHSNIWIWKRTKNAIEYFKNLHSQDALATVSCDQCKDFGFPYQIPNQNGVEFVF